MNGHCAATLDFITPRVLMMLFAGLTLFASPPVRGADVSPAGFYATSGGLYVVTITLHCDGSYEARWQADVGTLGVAAGSWIAQGDAIRLSPQKEDGSPMIGYLRVLLRREVGGKKALVRQEDSAAEASHWSYLYLQTPRAEPKAGR